MPRLAVLTTVALDTDPQSGPDARNGLKLAARSGRVGARFWLDDLPEALSLAPQGRSRRRERERAMVELVVVDSHGWRVVVSEEDAE
ncbi:hypothetical protein [Natrialbaceae archaeon AArc-T1-2]|uniref:hypothetical protein n=1 Tax=Natrialbaceae archaeon AArc-T1-2 TaxID=3053904 RepID=UPI00255AC517|nr:hypothetical protein [Natrialbaceae archaeon AArc-T1-2]WIV68905.1 hypothetical protein QQ977_17155 [Natrialbaceae archaeon AArc-T1-2]